MTRLSVQGEERDVTELIRVVEPATHLQNPQRIGTRRPCPMVRRSCCIALVRLGLLPPGAGPASPPCVLHAAAVEAFGSPISRTSWAKSVGLTLVSCS